MAQSWHAYSAQAAESKLRDSTALRAALTRRGVQLYAVWPLALVHGRGPLSLYSLYTQSYTPATRHPKQAADANLAVECADTPAVFLRGHAQRRQIL